MRYLFLLLLCSILVSCAKQQRVADIHVPGQHFLETLQGKMYYTPITLHEFGKNWIYYVRDIMGCQDPLNQLYDYDGIMAYSYRNECHLLQNSDDRWLCHEESVCLDA